MNKRRDFIKHTAILGTAAIMPLKQLSAFGIEQNQVYSLPTLGYEYDALEPFIDKQTMIIHHTKHHQAYITKLNEAMAADQELKGMSLEQQFAMLDQLPVKEATRMAIRNHGGGHWNHSFFWKLLKKGTQPGKGLSAALQKEFGSIDAFKAAFEKAALAQFGSGWAWLTVQNGKLKISTTANQDNPLMGIVAQQAKPIIGLDVWEHAYYLKYQNKRADYVKAFWEVLNWEQAEKNFSNN